MCAESIDMWHVDPEAMNRYLGRELRDEAEGGRERVLRKVTRVYTPPQARDSDSHGRGVTDQTMRLV
jgi:hypothetical protein